ncbi:MAG: iron ABC transporter permease, partial [Chloroflexota bacterium]
MTTRTSTPASQPLPTPRGNTLRRVLYGSVGALLLLLMALILYPSINLLYNTFRADDTLSLANYARVFATNRYVTVIGNSLFVSVFGTLGAVTLGLLLAWLIARTDVPGKPLWRALVIVPYLIPPFIGAIAWVYLLGPAGFVNRFWRDVFGSPLLVIYGRWGIILVMAFYTYPIAYLVNVGPLRQMNPVLEEAARISGAGTWRTLRDVTLPLMLPSIGASALLIFMSLMANFGIPTVLGFRTRYFVLTTEIYRTILTADMANNLQIAATLSMVLVGFAVVVILLQNWLRSGRRYTVLSGKNEQPRLVKLGVWKYPAVGLFVVVIAITVVAPLIGIFLTSIQRALGVPITIETATLAHYQTIFGMSKIGNAFRNSLLLAGGSATIIVFLSLIIAYLSVRMKLRGSGLLNTVVLIPYAIPGTVVALAMILAFLRPLPIIQLSIYNTIWILLIAYIARFLTFGVQSISASLEQVHESLEEAARISGADRVMSVRDVVLPLISSSVFAGWFLAFMPALTELTMSALLFSPGNETLGQVVFSLNQEGQVNLT